MEWIHEERILISIPYFSLIVKNYTEESCLHHRPQRCSSLIQGTGAENSFVFFPPLPLYSI